MATDLSEIQGPVIFAERAGFNPLVVMRRVSLAVLAILAVTAVIALRVVAWWPWA